MNRYELKEKLSAIGVKSNQYSLEGSLEADRIVLFQNYATWEVFYLDERGIRNDEKHFASEDEACLYIYELFSEAKSIETRFGLNS